MNPAFRATNALSSEDKFQNKQLTQIITATQ